VALLRQGIEAWNEGDVERMIEMCAADVELNPVVAGTVSGGVYRGHDGLRQFVRDYEEAFESFEFELDESDWHDFGDRVAWLGRLRAKGRDSGVELDQPFGIAVAVHDGKAVRFRSFLDTEEALKAIREGTV
jgi:ketosteroid isomerase-like protein